MSLIIRLISWYLDVLEYNYFISGLSEICCMKHIKQTLFQIIRVKENVIKLRYDNRASYKIRVQLGRWNISTSGSRLVVGGTRKMKRLRLGLMWICRDYWH